MAIDLYYMEASPPCRTVMLLAKQLGLALNLKVLDLQNGEHLRPSFVAINPQHCIPTIVDNGFILWESRAILSYLATKYGKNDAIYPKDPEQRFTVDRLLYFDAGTLYQRFSAFAYPVFLKKEKADPKKLEELHESLAWLDMYLDGHFFAVGNRITIADHTLVVSVSTFEACGIDLKSYRNIQNWLERCKRQMPGYEEVNGKGAAMMGKFLKTKLRF